MLTRETCCTIYKCCFFGRGLRFSSTPDIGKVSLPSQCCLLDQWKHLPQTYPLKTSRHRLPQRTAVDPVDTYLVEGCRPGNPANRPMPVLTRNWPCVCPPAHQHIFVGPVAGSVRNTSCRRDALETNVTPRQSLSGRWDKSLQR